MTVGVARAFHAIRINVGTRVGSVYRRRRSVGCVVICQREIDFASPVVQRAPFWAIHFSCTHRIGGKASVDQDIGLIGKCVPWEARNGRIADVEFQPVARTIVVELCGVEFSLVQVLVAGRHATAHIGAIPVGI